MTQAFNLAQLANNLNTSGQLDASDGLTGLIANANLASSGSASSSTYLRGDRTWASLPASGKILQVVYSQLNTTQSFASSSYNTISGLSCTLTPASTSSRFLVLFSCVWAGQTGHGVAFRMLRNGTFFNQPSGSYSLAHTGNENNGSDGGAFASFSTVDSPATTSSLTYTVATGQESAQTTILGVLSRGATSGEPGYPGNFPTTLTVMEIAS